ncbi:MAG: putative ABC exporter domain-containing protein [Gemmataceae bacterium]|nr:putative ABC exporter domain-containing protein [Gemmataceae bacterium]
MDRALWLLLWLTFYGWARRLRQMVQAPKGILLALFGMLLFAPMVFSLLLPTVALPREEIVETRAAVRQYAPLALLAYMVLVILSSSGERGLTFTPPEIGFLFPGPFSRRQLLAYKVVTSLLRSLLGTVMMTFFLRIYASNMLAAFVGLLLTTTFLQLFAIAASLLASTVGALAYSRGRKLILVVLAVLLIATAITQGRALAGESLRNVVEGVNTSPIFAVLLEPLRWFVNAFAAEQLWTGLPKWAALAFAIDALLLGLIFALDAQYLEASAVASERLYARLERLRSAGSAATLAGSSMVRLTLPSLPWWGGIGPIAWRQALGAVRGAKGMITLLGLFSLPFVASLLASGSESADGETFLLGMTGGLIAATLGVLPPLLTFDFRGDVDRIDFLKALPIPAVGLVLGQLVTPVAFSSALQLVLLVLLQVVIGGGEPVVWTIALFLIPFNLLVYEAENLTFLIYPVRTIPARPGDFQHLGRHLLVMMVKGLLVASCLGIVALAGLIAYLIAGRSWLAAGIATWIALAIIGTALVPVLVFFFHRFDVARDTPM